MPRVPGVKLPKDCRKCMVFRPALYAMSYTRQPYGCTIKIACFLQVRNTLSDFAILLGVVICTAIDAVLAVDTPKLLVPQEIKVLKNFVLVS